MHKNFRNTNQERPLIQQIIEKFAPKSQEIVNENNEQNLPVLERKIIQNLIENRVKSVGEIYPLQEDKIRKRLIKFIKKNKIALRYEHVCCRHVKRFTVAAFLFCEVCGKGHEALFWERCESCGNFNKYRIYSIDGEYN